MAFDSHKNLAYQTLGAGLSSGATSIALTADFTYVPSWPANATIWPAGTNPTGANAEIVRITADSSGTLTITRAQEGTSAKSFSSGDQIMVGLTAKTITDIEAYLTAAGIPTSFLANTAFGDAAYGDGSDGALTFDGTTTILGIAPSASTYTLTRDVMATNLTINNGVSIITNGFRIFANGTLTNNGTIQWNGTAASGTNGATGGASIGNGSSSINSSATTGSNAIGTLGGSGGTGVGTAGSANDSSGYSLTWGGQGGSGGAGSSGAGAAGGGLGYVASTTVNYEMHLRILPGCVTGMVFNSNRADYVKVPQGGTGGGSGGGDGSHNGGGGGGGGGIVIVAARLIAGTGTISANGGAGGSATVGNCGGGGGGGGGLVIVTSGSASANAITGQTITANGGVLGAKSGTGVAGSAGSAGHVFVVNN